MCNLTVMKETSFPLPLSHHAPGLSSDEIPQHHAVYLLAALPLVAKAYAVRDQIS